jgi:hypothetical protein
LKNATSFGCAVRAAFGAGAVVAVDVDDERVVQLAQVLEVLDHAADLVVAVRGIGSEDLHLADEELLLLGRQLVPGLQHLSGQGPSFVSCGITPRRFWFSKIVSRSFS